LFLKENWAYPSALAASSGLPYLNVYFSSIGYGGLSTSAVTWSPIDSGHVFSLSEQQQQQVLQYEALYGYRACNKSFV